VNLRTYSSEGYSGIQGGQFKELNVRSLKSYLSFIVMEQSFVILRDFVILGGETFIKSSNVWHPEFGTSYFFED